MILLEKVRYEGDICFVMPPQKVVDEFDLKGGEHIRVILLKSYDYKMRVVTQPEAEVFFESDHHHPHHWEIPWDVIGKYNIKDLGFVEFKVIDVFRKHEEEAEAHAHTA
ncbi:MAG: hypothetical protein R6U44_00195 [Archaeoglobaceae archaeon]